MIRTAIFTILVGMLASAASGQATLPDDKSRAPDATAAAAPSASSAATAAPSAPSAAAVAPASPAPAAPVPAAQAWPRTVEVLAKALAKGDAAEVDSVLSSRATLRTFDSSQAMGAGTLLRRVAKSTLVGQHAYTQSPLVMAADIAADFKNAASIDEKSKAWFLIDDDREMKNANSTAAQWVELQLGATAGVPTGAIVLWTPRPAPQDGHPELAPLHDAVFVLCRGVEVSPNEFKITTVIFGNPVPQMNP